MRISALERSLKSTGLSGTGCSYPQNKRKTLRWGTAHRPHCRWNKSNVKQQIYRNLLAEIWRSSWGNFAGSGRPSLECPPEFLSRGARSMQSSFSRTGMTLTSFFSNRKNCCTASAYLKSRRSCWLRWKSGSMHSLRSELSARIGRSSSGTRLSQLS